MSDSSRQPRLLANLPLDVILKIFSECDVDDVLNLSATCKWLNEASGEHQTWLDQVTRRLKTPVPTSVVLSTAELKDWAISWLRSDKLWVKPHNCDDSLLGLHCFKMPEYTRFVMAKLVPGGRFIVVLYNDGSIDLKAIDIESEGEWKLRDVARHRRNNPEKPHMIHSELLTETRLGCTLIAYLDDEGETPCLIVFLVDHIAATIEQKQVVKLDGVRSHKVYGIHARGNNIVCFYDHGHGWGIIVSELGPGPALKHFNLAVNGNPNPADIQFFTVSENAVVVCDVEGIHLYHIPELSSAESLTLKPVWEWRGESKWLCGSAYTTPSQRPILYLQEVSVTHTAIFHMDASGRDPIIAEHRISEGPRAYLASIKGGNRQFMMKGRKGLCYKADLGIFKFGTCLAGREELAGRFTAVLENYHQGKFADFDERTGRIILGTGYDLYVNCATCICLADLPPLCRTESG